MEETPLSALTIRPFQAEDQQACRELILDGLREHWGELDLTLNTDLADIGAAYAEGVFLVARETGRLVATAALLPRGEGTAEIVRMSVRRAQRRRGLGTKMLQALIDEARRNGIQRIILETTSSWTEVIAFYQRNGFKITHTAAGDTWFKLELSSPK